MTRLLLIALFTTALIFSTERATASIELITNGDFETGDFTGWANSATGAGLEFTINGGSFNPTGPGGALAPIAGQFDAVSSQTSSALNLVTQIFQVPLNITNATFSWADRIRNFGGQFSDPNQEFRVLIEDMAGGLIQEIFSTDPGDPLQQVGPNNRLFDLTTLLQSLAGQDIQIAFEQQDNLLYFNATIDNVSLQVDVIPEPTAALVWVVLASCLGGTTLRRRFR
ncbi:MAG: hypothetical protein GXP24_09430 [Planctomycetes bacterium]|nr:hypothetical protein [Planctomycetota bacterium]